MRINVDLPGELWDFISEFSKSEDRPPKQQLVHIIREAMNARKTANKPAPAHVCPPCSKRHADGFSDGLWGRPIGTRILDTHPPEKVLAADLAGHLTNGDATG